MHTIVYTLIMISIQIAGFQWDSGNTEKCQKHGVTIVEIEYAFAHDPAIGSDIAHSLSEDRLLAIGKTEAERSIFVVFTVRDGMIRPVSARYMHQREVQAYEKEDTRI